DFYAGKDLAKRRAEMKASAERARTLVEATRKAGGATFAVAATELARARGGLGGGGGPGDAGGAVRLGGGGHAARPPPGTRSALASALLVRADAALARQEPAYQALVTPARRSLSPAYLVAFALGGPDRVREAALANADVRRAAELTAEAMKALPEDADEWDWAVLRAGHPEQDAAVAAFLKGDEAAALQRTI